MTMLPRIFHLVLLLSTSCGAALALSGPPSLRQTRRLKTKVWGSKIQASDDETVRDDFHSTQAIERSKSPSLPSSSRSLLASISSRRDALQVAGGLALSSFVLGIDAVSALDTIPADSSSLSASSTSSPKSILLTGSNSGIGFEAAKRLAAQGANLILPCRTMAKSIATIDSLTNEFGFSKQQFLAAECDLASLASIDAFVTNTLQSQQNIKNLDVVCLNAGLARNTDAKDVARTPDGFELTVGTNHLGHFYLQDLLQPLLKKDGGRIVVTASGVHDPESPGGAQGVPATLGNLFGFERDGKRFSMVDGGEFNADKAYKDSKLCNVLFTRELQRRLDFSEATKGMTANCFNPGLIVGTGLFRDQNPVFTKLFDFAATDLFKVGESTEWGGGCVTYMATNVNTKGKYYSSPPGSAKYGDAGYGREFTVTQVSKEAQDDEKARRLWELSAQLVGITA